MTILNDWRFWFVAPMVLALGTVVLFPSAYLVGMSLTHWIVTDPQRGFDGLGNFRVLFASSDFIASVGATLTYLIASTVLMVVFAMGLAMALAAPRTPSALRSIVIMPLVIPPVVAGFTWRFLMNGEMGFLGAFLLPAVGLKMNMLADPVGAMISVVIADVWSRAPFMFLIFLAAMQSIPRETYEAIRLDGANRAQEFLHVTLPMIRPAVVVALLFRVIDAINTFELIYVMTKGGPGRATQTLALFGWKTAFQHFDFGLAAALGVVMIVVTTLCASIAYRRFLRPAT